MNERSIFSFNSVNVLNYRKYKSVNILKNYKDKNEKFLNAYCVLYFVYNFKVFFWLTFFF